MGEHKINKNTDPTFADRVYQWTFWTRKLAEGFNFMGHDGRAYKEAIEKGSAKLREELKRARRFTISEDVKRALNVPPDDTHSIEKLEALVETARLPFPVMWFEDENRQFGQLLWRSQVDDPTEWNFCCYRIDPTKAFGEDVDTVVAGGFIGASQYAEALNSESLLTFEDNRMISRGWGFTTPRTHDDLVRLAKVGMFGIEPFVTGQMAKMSRGSFDRVKAGLYRDSDYMAGSLLFICRAVAMINSPHATYLPQASHGFYRYRLKNHPYLTTQTITLNIAPHQVVKYISNEIDERLRVKKRAHEVHGHWRHYVNAAACDPSNHDWNPDPVDDGLHHCSRCAGRRRWISEHMRGDASLGYVEHKYNVVHEPA